MDIGTIHHDPTEKRVATFRNKAYSFALGKTFESTNQPTIALYTLTLEKFSEREPPVIRSIV